MAPPKSEIQAPPAAVEPIATSKDANEPVPDRFEVKKQAA
jgi:hypothetical protein